MRTQSRPRRTSCRWRRRSRPWRPSGQRTPAVHLVRRGTPAEGEAALVSGDVGPRLEMWSHHDPVTLFAAVGPTKAGWSELEPTFRAVAARLSGGRDVRYDLLAFDVSGDVAWSAGLARFVVSMDGAPMTSIVIRLTHAYRREDGAWKVVHEHSDFQPPDRETPPAIGS